MRFDDEIQEKVYNEFITWVLYNYVSLVTINNNVENVNIFLRQCLSDYYGDLCDPRVIDEYTFNSLFNTFKYFSSREPEEIRQLINTIFLKAKSYRDNSKYRIPTSLEEKYDLGILNEPHYSEEAKDYIGDEWWGEQYGW